MLTHHAIAVENPKIVLIVGSVGLGLNLLVMSFLHGMDVHVLNSCVFTLMKYDQNTTMEMDTVIVIVTATVTAMVTAMVTVTLTVMNMHTAWMLK